VFVLTFIATVIRVCNRADFDVGRLQGVVSNFIGLAIIVAHRPTFLQNFHKFYSFIPKLWKLFCDKNLGAPVI